MTIQDYVKKVEIAEKFFNTADVQYNDLAIERLELAKRELELFIKACKLDGTRGAVQRV